jgi:cytochrome c oxidase subunit IV
MSTTQTPPAPDATDPHVHHPTPRDYVRIAVILFVLTAMEVSTYFLDFGAIAVPLLIVLMLIKFVLVASWFMHLKFDTKLYGRFLYGGMILAFSLYAITLTLFAFDHAPSL